MSGYSKQLGIIASAMVAAFLFSSFSVEATAPPPPPPPINNSVCTNITCNGSAFRFGMDICNTTNNATGWICQPSNVQCQLLPPVKGNQLTCKGTLQSNGVTCSVTSGKCK